MTLADKTAQGEAINILVHNHCRSMSVIRIHANDIRKALEATGNPIPIEVSRSLIYLESSTKLAEQELDKYYKKFQKDFQP